MDGESKATEDFHSVKVFADYGGRFYSSHQDLGHVAASWGGMLMGAMRAILECPDHPGKFRIPQDDNWDVIVCPECGVWTRKDDSEKVIEHPKKTRKKSVKRQTRGGEQSARAVSKALR